MKLGTKVTLVPAALRGDRSAIAKLISLVEDGGPELGEVMSAIFPHTGKAFTVGITGAPGAGKSTLTEGLIGKARDAGHSVGVLAIDPSSPFTGGALLGDRVRMQSRTSDEKVFIRSMATRGHLGGLALASPEAVRILDASGSEYILIETVGVGQDEVEIVEAADTTVVVVTPGWGDGVQAGKAGFLEIADIFVVNKADREGTDSTVRELNQMIDLAPKSEGGSEVAGRRPPVIETVATEEKGIGALWAAIGAHRTYLEESGGLQDGRRRRVAKEIMTVVTEEVRAKARDEARTIVEGLVERVVAREIDPYAAARELLGKLGIE